MLVIGIDGGGTKTEAVLAHVSGEIMTHVTVGASNPNLIDEATLLTTFKELFSKLEQQKGEKFSQVHNVFAGISGAGHPQAREKLREMITSIVPEHVGVTVDHDALIALYSGTRGQSGIVQISGTGSITYGINGQGKRGRVGGWGHLLGETGSGYSLGSNALQAVFNSYDGLERKTLLSELIFDFFAVREAPDLVPIIYQNEISKEKIASLSRIVMEAAEQKDFIAKKIINHNAKDIGQSIACLANRLFPQAPKHESINVVCTGGIFKRLDLFQAPIEKELSKQGIQADFIKPTIEPVGGAVIAAMRAANATVGEDFITKFTQLE